MSTLNITGPEGIDYESVRTYQACVNYMAKWVELRQSDTKLTAPEIFDEFKANVCRVMADGVAGSG